TACWRCHPGGQLGEFSGADPECLSCHAADLLGALDPDHASLGWTARCDRCHLSTQWDGAGFRHSIFALSGAHALANCVDCHDRDVFVGISGQCVACHQDAYDAALDPPHVLHNYPLRCELCHTDVEWEGATVHPRPFAGQCVNCHEGEYLATTNPNHAGQGMPTRCDLCHNVQSWSGDHFVHPWPRIGTHSFMACLDCHLDAPSIVQPGSCTHCHAHRQKASEEQHLGIEGYIWSNRNCLACHPDGV
ncbi:MAG: hypothetical protein KDB61_10795, partial [Planctomycetes bacterium]|nr:hypothetical protein [Planctomycetota bacterium]